MLVLQFGCLLRVICYQYPSLDAPTAGKSKAVYSPQIKLHYHSFVLLNKWDKQMRKGFRQLKADYQNSYKMAFPRKISGYYEGPVKPLECIIEDKLITYVVWSTTGNEWGRWKWGQRYVAHTDFILYTDHICQINR